MEQGNSYNTSTTTTHEYTYCGKADIVSNGIGSKRSSRAFSQGHDFISVSKGSTTSTQCHFKITRQRDMSPRSFTREKMTFYFSGDEPSWETALLSMMQEIVRSEDA